MKQMQKHLKTIIQTPLLHARFLNTLSYLENCGAKLIAKSEHPTMVSKEILKHAAEESRHAYYLKSQIKKIYPKELKSYKHFEILCGFQTKHYLDHLNLKISRHLKRLVSNPILYKQYAYLLVSFAIEVRAKEIYPLYQKILEEINSPISIINIIRDEENHFYEIYKEIEQNHILLNMVEDVKNIESLLFDSWLYKFTEVSITELPGNPPLVLKAASYN